VKNPSAATAMLLRGVSLCAVGVIEHGISTIGTNLGNVGVVLVCTLALLGQSTIQQKPRDDGHLQTPRLACPAQQTDLIM
jgi:hypothetical protein